ncbi:growth arrest and DNA damage-inducible protein GADD45 alpha [Trichechus manatus latirostris]|uniref:Growth arrest and DNA damage-inducible protein GADD45 alpha n=1 Tax=Trichechus manatus latirostris TaxID=127582 RepID=A0A2Y9D7T8_TRIMA|nr:growth arrest and DNA damage-inducible protein GADD45 alpha [Trichechus manatus latirostris]
MAAASKILAQIEQPTLTSDAVEVWITILATACCSRRGGDQNRHSQSDPDNVVLCLLAADEDDDRDVALQIHFTLIQAFCCENDINILRVSNPGRLAELLLLEPDASRATSEGAEQPPDLHCVLVTNPHSSQWKDPALSQLICFCRESRYMDQWVPVINLPER